MVPCHTTPREERSISWPTMSSPARHPPPAGGKQQQQQQQQQQPTLKLPKEIADHYARHGIESVEEYLVGAGASSATTTATAYRFVRLNPRYDEYETLSLLRKELAASASTSIANATDQHGNNNPSISFPLAVPWLNERLGFYALPADFGLARSECFRTGRVYGMDISSGAAVAALLYDDHDVKNNQKSKDNKEMDDVVVGQTVNDKDVPSLRVLDLCCSPGLKLCALSDLLSSNSTVVGVDISESRISLCKKIITKYQINRQTSGRSTTSSTGDDCTNDAENRSSARIRLYCQDGTQFGLSSFRDNDKLVFDSEIAREDEHVVAGKRKRMNKSARARQQKRLRTVAHLDFVDSATRRGSKEGDEDQGKEEEQSICCHLFDRVLVDAECSTDGAIKHLKHKLKQEQSNADESDAQATSALSKSGISKLGDEAAMADLVDLQRRLIMSGFRLLKRGGTLVYSTCSLSEEQNEGVVNWLLQQCCNSFIIPVSFNAPLNGSGVAKEEEKNFLISEGGIPGTVRFRPKLHCPFSNEGDDGSNSCSKDALLFGGGFWLAKIGKR